jgi:acetyl-CoA acyltransferase 1
MSLFSMMGQVDHSALSDKVYEHDHANKCLFPMGMTPENVAEKYGITRAKQDQMAFESH